MEPINLEINEEQLNQMRRIIDLYEPGDHLRLERGRFGVIWMLVRGARQYTAPYPVRGE